MSEDPNRPIRSDDRGFLYGDGLFETVRVHADGQVRWLDRHIGRLRRSARTFGYPEGHIDVAVRALEGLPDRRPGLWRVTLTRPGQGAPFGGTGTVRLRHRPHEPRRRPRLTLLTGLYHPDDQLAEHKTTSYLRSIEARRRAVAAGFDDAVLASHEGVVGEASASNVVLVREGRAVTPRFDGVLPGVTIRGLIALALEAGEMIELRRVTADELDEADEVVLTSAGVGVIAAASHEGRELDDAWATKAAGWLEEAR